MRSNIAENVTIENVAEKWKKVADMSNAQHLDSIQEATMALVSSLDKLRSSSSSSDRNKSGDDSGDVFTFTSKDVILYALGGMIVAKMLAHICID